MIERLVDAGLVVQSCERSYVAAVCLWPYSEKPDSIPLVQLNRKI